MGAMVAGVMVNALLDVHDNLIRIVLEPNNKQIQFFYIFWKFSKKQHVL